MRLLLLMAWVTMRLVAQQPAVDDLRSTDPAVRRALLGRAHELGEAALPGLAEALHAADPAEARAALRALERLAARATAPAAPEGARDRVAEALARLVSDTGLARPVRQSLLQAYGLVNRREEGVQLLVAALDDRDLAEGALFALQRSGVAKAEVVLLERLTQPGPVLRAADFAAALGGRGSRAAVAGLAAVASGDDALAQAARAALAASGDPRAGTALLEAVRLQRAGAAAAYARWLESHGGDAEAQRAGYRRLLASAGSPARLAALEGLARLQDQELVAVCVDLLADPQPAVRAAARGRLIAAADQGLTRRLHALHPDLSPQARAELLRILAARGDCDAAALLQLVHAGLTDGAPSLRGAACEVLGASADADAGRLQPLLGDADRGVRDSAAAALVQVARRQLARGRGAEGLAGLREVVRAAPDPRVQAQAVALLGQARDAGALALLAPLAEGRDLREPVAAARVEIARGLVAREPERARAVLREAFLQARERGTRQAAAKELEQLGVAPADLARESGYLVAWHVLGPVPDPRAETLGRAPFATDAVDTGKPVRIGAKDLEWRSVMASGAEGVVDLRAAMAQDQVSAFAVTTFEWSGGEAVLEVGSDDGCAVWLNGTRVQDKWAFRGLSSGEDQIAVTPTAGRNVLVLHVHQGGGGFEFCVRLRKAAPAGEPARGR
ncbi:MAG: hypothetical protein IT458_08680 [Planctomycetes bacterium]|nr:hypothetical protein [Planctomycetota bacterium]